MDIKRLTSEEINNLSTEEKKEFIRSLIHSEDVKTGIVFHNATTNETLDIKDLAEAIEEEELLDTIVQALEKAETKTLALTGTEIKELMKKALIGECSPEELSALEFVTSQLEQEDSIQFGHHWLDSTLSLIHFAQDTVHYNPTLDDMLSAASILVSLSNMFIEGNSFSKYNPSDIEIISEMSSQIANDIYNTWKDSCEELPEPELIVVGLLRLASKIAQGNKLKFCKATDISNMLGITLFDEEDDENQDTENGSNEQDDCACMCENE